VTAAGLLALSAVVLNGPGLLVSLWFDAKGLPAGWDDQTTPRKRGTLRLRLPLIALNLAILYGSAILALTLFSERFPVQLPTLSTGALTLGVLVLADDLWFYVMHRYLHVHKELYRRVHKLHHEAFAPVPIEYIYAHPVEWMTGALGPAAVIVGTVLLTGEMSAYVLVGWQAWRTLHELDIHSGLRAPLTRHLPLWAGMKHHDLHHAKPTKGNYASSFTLWDRVFGTLIDDPVPRRPRSSSEPPAT
jgi:sterol desaturase/sphingolipid hydroxylase (fatty acid hydroxylase superfamily)